VYNHIAFSKNLDTPASTPDKQLRGISCAGSAKSNTWSQRTRKHWSLELEPQSADFEIEVQGANYHLRLAFKQQ
jgi:hypothetical protein